MTKSKGSTLRPTHHARWLRSLQSTWLRHGSLLRQATTPTNRSLRSRFAGDPGRTLARAERRSLAPPWDLPIWEFRRGRRTPPVRAVAATQDQRRQQGGDERPHEHGGLRLLAAYVVEREVGDQQRHREPDTRQQGHPEQV